MTRKNKNDRRKGSALPWLLILALLVAALLYLRCKGGLGLGSAGLGTEDEDEPKAVAADLPDAGVPRCTLRLSAEGITVDGRAVSADQAIAACKRGGADVIVTGDARQGDWDSLRAALDAAGVVWFERGAAATRVDGGP